MLSTGTVDIRADGSFFVGTLAGARPARNVNPRVRPPFATCNMASTMARSAPASDRDFIQTTINTGAISDRGLNIPKLETAPYAGRCETLQQNRLNAS